MFFARLATENDIVALKDLLEDVKYSQINSCDLIMLGSLDELVVSTASLKIRDSLALMHSLTVKKEFRDQYLGDSTARSIIHLADNHDVKFIYTYSDNLEISYFLAKMGYKACEIDEIRAYFPKALPDRSEKLYGFKLDLEEFFNQSCNCNKNK